jgi:hypothetical protein
MEEVKKTRSKLAKTGSFFFIVGFCYFIFSMSTKSWEPVEAKLLSSSSNTITTSEGGPSFRHRMGAGSSFSLPVVNYEYQFKGKVFNSSTVCICVPIGIDIPLQNSIRAYVAPYYPSLSVLVQGPHFILLLILTLVGGACFLASSFLKNYEKA